MKTIAVVDTSSLDSRHSMHLSVHNMIDYYKSFGFNVTYIQIFKDQRSSRLVKFYYRYFYALLFGYSTSADYMHIVDHSFSHISLFRRKPSIITIHDIIPLDPQANNYQPFYTRLFFYLVVLIGLLRARYIHCVSNYTMCCLKSRFPFIKADKFIVKYNPLPVINQDSIQIDKQFDVLLIGSQWYKNHNYSSKILLMHPNMLKICCLNISPGVLSRLDNSIHEVVKLTNIPDISSLYMRSAIIFNLSLIEGFGLTPFEASVHGCTPLISNIDIHRELHPSSCDSFIPLNDINTAYDIFSLVLTSKSEKKLRLSKVLNDYKRVNYFSSNDSLANCIS